MAYGYLNSENTRAKQYYLRGYKSALLWDGCLKITFRKPIHFPTYLQTCINHEGTRQDDKKDCI